MSSITLVDHILFAVLAFVLPLFAIFRVRGQVTQIPTETSLRIKLYWLNSAILWLGAIITIGVWWFSDRPWAEMGWILPGGDHTVEWIILCAWFGLLYMSDAMFSWNALDEHPSAQLLPKNRRELLHFGSVVSFSAAFCEEIIFRGFMVTYLVGLLDGMLGTVVAIVGSGLVFALLHAYQGWIATIKILILTILFGWIFVLSGSLVPVIILHFMVDLIGGFLGVANTVRKDRVLPA